VAIDFYVDSTAAGDGLGGSWVNGAATVGAASGQAAGAHVAVSKNHAETGGSAVAVTFSNATIANPIKIICRDPADDSLATGGSITTTGTNDRIALVGSIYVYGMTINADEDVQIAGGTTDQYQCWENCTFGHGASSDANREIQVGSVDTSDARSTNADLINCTFNPSANPIKLGARGLFRYYGCVFNLETAAGLSANIMHGSTHRFEGCNFAGDANPTTFFSFRNGTGQYSECHIRNSILPGAITTANGTGNTNQQLLIENSEDGTIIVPPLGLNWLENPYGTIKATLAKYRTGGATDKEQANAYAWDMVSSANCIEGIRGLESPPIPRWVKGGSAITSTIHFAGGATMNDDDVGIKWLHPDQTAAPNATALHEQTIKRITDVAEGTPAAHTTDSGSTWNGTGVGTKQQHSTASYTPTEAGHTYVRVMLYKPSTTLTIDPQVANT